MDLEEKNALMEERRLHDLELQRIFGTTSIRCSEEEYEKVSKEVIGLRDRIDTITKALEDEFLNAYDRNTIEIKDIFKKLVNDDVKDLKMAFNELYEIGDFVTKGEAMKAAVSALKLQLLKKDLPGRIDEIDAFNSSLESLKSFYKNSLELAVSAKKIATKNLEVELETKTRIISDQQQKVDELNLRIENLQNTVNDSNEEKLALQKELDRVNALIIDKDALIQSLKNSLAVRLIEDFSRARLYFFVTVRKRYFTDSHLRKTRAFFIFRQRNSEIRFAEIKKRT